MDVPARISIVTLGVTDVAASAVFYGALGWERCTSSNDDICWFRTTGSYLGLFGRDALAEDAGVQPGTGGAFSGVTLAMNVVDEAAVTDALEAAVAVGATLIKPAVKADWGGFSGYFADPDGQLWEVAWNPFFPLDVDGQVSIP